MHNVIAQTDAIELEVIRVTLYGISKGPGNKALKQYAEDQ